MKTLVVLLIASGLYSVPSLASSAAVKCDGTGIENLGVYKDQGKLVGNVSWDCWPGGGICNEEAAVRPVKLGNGDIIFSGKYFKLIVHTSVAPVSGQYRAHVIATDMVDSGNLGRGLTINQYVMCQLGK
jgi:hypothetical protein